MRVGTKQTSKMASQAWAMTRRYCNLDGGPCTPFGRANHLAETDIYSICLLSVKRYSSRNGKWGGRHIFFIHAETGRWEPLGMNFASCPIGFQAYGMLIVSRMGCLQQSWFLSHGLRVADDRTCVLVILKYASTPKFKKFLSMLNDEFHHVNSPSSLTNTNLPSAFRIGIISSPELVIWRGFSNFWKAF